MTKTIKILMENWPNLNLIQLGILHEIDMHPGSCMTDIAERLKINLSTVHFHARTLADGFQGRRSFDLVRVEVGQDDGRTRILSLTDQGLEVAKHLRAWVKHPVKQDEEQLDLFEPVQSNTGNYVQADHVDSHKSLFAKECNQ